MVTPLAPNDNVASSLQSTAQGWGYKIFQFSEDVWHPFYRGHIVVDAENVGSWKAKAGAGYPSSE